LYQQNKVDPLLLRNHPLAIGFSPEARGTVGTHCTVA
jgi:hypothetical protein